MCGIGGTAGVFHPGLAARMNAILRHRGPDGEGVFEDPHAALALTHRRLAILDLSPEAAQPMASPDGRHILVYNGEIYNFRDLRRDLEAHGHTFRSTGDTEVVLTGLCHHGPAFLARLNGMFALALWDTANRRLLLARDPLGIKPLYLCEPAPGAIAFASEIKALLLIPGVSPRPNFDALAQHLAFCHATGDETAFAGITQLPPGRMLVWDAAHHRTTVSPFWQVPMQPETPFTHIRDATAWLRETLGKAVSRQLVSDVPVGIPLSGGLDSSLIATLAAQEARDQLRSFTIRFPAADNITDQTGLDGPLAAQLADDLGIEHQEIEFRPEVASLLPQLIYHLDEPIADPAAIAAYLIAKFARESQRIVLLSGQGADEVFAGYPRYRAMAATAALDRLPRLVREHLARAATRVPAIRENRFGGTIRRVRRVLRGLPTGADHRFLTYAASTPEPEIARVWSPAVKALLHQSSPLENCEHFMAARGLDGMRRWLDRDLHVYLPRHNLLYTDKMGMAASVEARVPFLDLEIMAMAMRLPISWRVTARADKIVLRHAAQGIIPNAIIHRPKAGFGAPYRKWLRHDLSALWHDVTSERAVRQRGWFDHQALCSARDRSQSGAEDLYMLQWAVLTIELWAREYLDRPIQA